MATATLMTADDMRAARETMGLSAQGLADLLLLGAGGGRTVRRWESGASAINGPVTLALRFLLAEYVAERAAEDDQAMLDNAY